MTNEVLTVHKHRACARCGLPWSHVADGKRHAHSCADGGKSLACTVRAPSMAGSLGAGETQQPVGGRTGGIVDVITDGIRGGVDAIGGIVDGIMRPISDIIRTVDRAEALTRVIVIGGAATYVYLKTRPQRVIIAGDSTRPRGRSTRRRRKRS